MKKELYELLEGINRAESLTQVYDSAMDFIRSALRCHKVSILRLDEAGIMRFVASQGLSEAYRRALEGHSPWSADAQDPQPLLISDIKQAPLEDHLRERISAEGIGALAFIPLTYERRLLGKFMIYFEAPHEFAPDELRLAQGIATQLATAIQRLQSDDALRQSEERYRRVIEQVKGYAIFSTDKHGRPTMWNEGVRRILGFGRAEFVGQEIMSRIFTPEDIRNKIPEREFETAVREGTATNNRWMIRKDGTRFWAEGITTAIRDQTDNLLGFSKLFRDATFARSAQEDLQKWKFLFDHAGWAVAAMDAEQKLLEVVNPAFAQMHGYTVPELLGAPFELTFAPEHLSELPKHVAASQARGDYVYESLHQRKDGSVFPVLTHVTALKDNTGRILFSAATFQNITHRKRNEEQMAELRNRLTADLNAMTHLQALGARAAEPDVDFEDLFTEVLDAAISITGADRGNLQVMDQESGGLKIVAYRGFEPVFLDFFQHVVDQTAACAAAAKARQRIIVEDVTRSNLFQNTPALQVLLDANVHAVQSTPLLSREGKVLGMISTHFSKAHRPSENELRFLDILARQAADAFERSKAEQVLRETKEQLAKYNLELDQKVQQRTASLDEAMRSLETLLYTIAHDLRAPNRAMQGYAELLLKLYAAKLDDRGKFFLRRINDAALKNEALIRDLLEYGRLSHAELPCEPIDPEGNVRNVLQALELQIAAKQAKLDVASQWPKVMANTLALSHIFTNLVGNALNYARPEVSPHIEIFPQVLNGHRSEGTSHSRVRLCVRDNGIGVPADQTESIFEPFQRASNANYEGTGIGLAIVRKAAERMGGYAGVDSTLDGGSTFWVELGRAASE